MASPSTTKSAEDDTGRPALPSWLAKHAQIDFNDDDVAALLTAIDSSQMPQESSLAQLPAELLLLTLEHVPVDYLLNWRLVCRGFRDAIDGRILYHHLQRTQLIGFIGPHDAHPMSQLSPEQYERLRLVHANFQDVENGCVSGQSKNPGAIWNNTYALLHVENDWLISFRDIVGIEASKASEDFHGLWERPMERLQLRLPEQGFGTLRWCIKLDHTILDLSFPLDITHNPYGFEMCLATGIVRVKWRNMLFNHLKTEAALRCMYEKKKNDSFTFSPAEDCLREVRRQRMHAGLNADSKTDRHTKWALRLLPPLFGKPQLDHTTLEPVENVAVDTLLLLRREAALSSKQLKYLRQLNVDHQAMNKEIDELSKEFDKFTAHLKPALAFSFMMPMNNEDNVPRNPIAWPDDLRAIIEGRVSKWKSQRKVIRQMQTLLSSSNEALTVPEDSFDDLGSQL